MVTHGMALLARALLLLKCLLLPLLSSQMVPFFIDSDSIFLLCFFVERCQDVDLVDL